MPNGLTKDDAKIFLDLVTKANHHQLKMLRTQVYKEEQRREDRITNLFKN